MYLANIFNSFPPAAMVANTLVTLLIFYGLAKRREAEKHMKIMVTCFVLDVINVVVVELGARLRDKEDGEYQGAGAVEEGLSSLLESSNWMLNFHVLVSTLAIVGYVVAVITGRKLFKQGTCRKAHKINAGIFLVTRMSSFVTSFLV